MNLLDILSTSPERVNLKLVNIITTVHYLLSNLHIQQVGSTAKIMFDFTTSRGTRNISFHLQVSTKSYILF